MNNLDPIPLPERPDCEEALAALHRHLDGESDWDSPPAALHRAVCQTCREELLLAGSLRRLPDDAVVPAGFSNRTQTRIQRGERTRRVQRWVAGAAAMAGAIVVAILGWPPAPPPETVRPDPVPVVILPAPIAEPKPDPEPKRPVGDSLNEAREAIVGLTRRTANETRDQSSMLLPMPRMEPMNPTEGLEPLADVRNGASRGVDPVQQSARRALNFLIRTADPPDRR